MSDSDDLLAAIERADFDGVLRASCALAANGKNANRYGGPFDPEICDRWQFTDRLLTTGLAAARIDSNAHDFRIIDEFCTAHGRSIEFYEIIHGQWVRVERDTALHGIEPLRAFAIRILPSN